MKRSTPIPTMDVTIIDLEGDNRVEKRKISHFAVVEATTKIVKYRPVPVLYAHESFEYDINGDCVIFKGRT